MNIFVCIPTYKRPQFLPDCIDSIMRLSVNSDITLRIVVVDNDSEQSAKPIYDSYQTTPHPFIYLNQIKKGLSNARNMAIEYAIAESADGILYVDDDMRLPSYYLQHLVDAMRKYSADAVRGMMQIIDKDGNREKVRRASLSLKRDMLAGNGVLVGKKIYKEYGLRFEPRYMNAFEDGDFFYHAYTKGAILYQISTVFDELRLPDRMPANDRKKELPGLLGTRKRHVHIRKYRGGIMPAMWYVLRRSIPIAMQIMALILILPFTPRKSIRKILNKLYQITGLFAGLLTAHYF